MPNFTDTCARLRGAHTCPIPRVCVPDRADTCCPIMRTHASNRFRIYTCCVSDCAGACAFSIAHIHPPDLAGMSPVAHIHARASLRACVSPYYALARTRRSIEHTHVPTARIHAPDCTDTHMRSVARTRIPRVRYERVSSLAHIHACPRFRAYLCWRKCWAHVL